MVIFHWQTASHNQRIGHPGHPTILDLCLKIGDSHFLWQRIDGTTKKLANFGPNFPRWVDPFLWHWAEGWVVRGLFDAGKSLGEVWCDESRTLFFGVEQQTKTSKNDRNAKVFGDVSQVFWTADFILVVIMLAFLRPVHGNTPMRHPAGWETT